MKSLIKSGPGVGGEGVVIEAVKWLRCVNLVIATLLFGVSIKWCNQ